MSGIRVLVGTRKGAFVLTSDGSRKSWRIEGPHFAGWEIYHVKGSPADPKRLYASQSSGWFGQVLQRSNDGGKTWEAAGNDFQYEGTTGTHTWYDGSPHPWEFKRVWHIEPSRPNTLFMQKHWDVMRSDDGAESWREISGNLPTDFGFVIDVNSNEPDTVYVVPITSDSHHFVSEGKLRVYRSKTGGDDWEALTKGLPQKDCYVNVLRDAMTVDQLDPCGVYFGTSGGQVYASADGGDSWNVIVRDLPPVLSVEVQTLK